MLVLIKGAGDLATGIAHRLKMSGFNIVMTDIERPTVVRHTVSFASAVYNGTADVEGIRARKCENFEQIKESLEDNSVAVIVDPKATIISTLRPDVVIDAIIAKKNIGTSKSDAKIVIGVGPGFEAGVDVDYVVETKRGHYLGKVITSGSAIPNTGVPGEIGGYSKERIIRAPQEGIFKPLAKIGDGVKKGDIVAYVDDTPVLALMPGTVRGILIKNIKVIQGFKCGDIDPRCNLEHCFTISDKARAIGGGVLEAIMRGGRKDE